MNLRFWIMLLVAFPYVAQADTAPDSKMAAAALQAADQAVKQAGDEGVQWTSTLALLKAAHAAESAGQFAAAQQQAIKAKAMAELSIQEGHEQASLWRAQVIK